MKAKTIASDAKLVPTHPLALPRRSSMTLSAYSALFRWCLNLFDQKLRGNFTSSGQASAAEQQQENDDQQENVHGFPPFRMRRGGVALR
jgi:hypothetical protein